MRNTINRPTLATLVARTRGSRVVGLALAVFAAGAVGALPVGPLAASAAYAGQWMQVSCANPDESPAPSQGWTSFTTGSTGYASNNGTSCTPTSAMYALLSTDAAAEVGTGENLQYTPPSGSTLAGGNVDVSLYADGYGAAASGTAVLYTPAFAYDGSDVFFQCAWGLSRCRTAPTTSPAWSPYPPTAAATSTSPPAAAASRASTAPRAAAKAHGADPSSLG